MLLLRLLAVVSGALAAAANAPRFLVARVGERVDVYDAWTLEVSATVPLAATPNPLALVFARDPFAVSPDEQVGTGSSHDNPRILHVGDRTQVGRQRVVHRGDTLKIGCHTLVRVHREGAGPGAGTGPRPA